MSQRTRFASIPIAVLFVFLAIGPVWAQPPQGQKYALVVGVRHYDSAKLDPLKFTENDAEELNAVLRKSGGFLVRVLTTSRGEKIKADAPTVANIRAEIAKLLAKKTRHDTILVAFSGHGIQAKVSEGGKEKDESFFCPANAQLNDNSTLIALGKLFKDLDGCGAGVKLLLVDACRNDPAVGRNVDVDSLPRLPRGSAALFSCKSGERAFESPKRGKGHGVFFYHVLEGLKGKAKNSRGEVTWGGLVEYVTDQVSDDVPGLIGGGAKQTPELKVNPTGKSPVLVVAVAKTGKETTGKATIVKTKKTEEKTKDDKKLRVGTRVVVRVSTSGFDDDEGTQSARYAVVRKGTKGKVEEIKEGKNLCKILLDDGGDEVWVALDKVEKAPAE
jgi:Caspase domain